MITDSYFYLALGASVMVTLTIRLIPFVLVKFVVFPDRLQIFLKYMPISLMTALFLNTFWSKNDSVITFDLTSLLVAVPALIIGWYRQSLTWVVIIGVITMALWRLFGS